MTRTDLEQLVDLLNASIFLREFSFSRNQFRPTPREEKEFTDHVVCMGDTWILIQTKGRDPTGATSDAALHKWFTKKVIGVGSRQIRDTLGYLRECSSIVLHNERGHAIDLARATPTTIHKVIVYDVGNLATVPDWPKFRMSRTAGFIHLLAAADYVELCRRLITPAELCEYFAFRQRVLSMWEARPREKTLFGQYLLGRLDDAPVDLFDAAADRLVNDESEFDIRFLTQTFLEHTSHGGGGTNYYRILEELARLTRGELRKFKELLQTYVDAVRNDKPLPAARMFVNRTGCGFVFVWARRGSVAQSTRILEGVVRVAKHSLRAEKQVGLVIAKSSRTTFDMDWAFLQGPWSENAELDRLLAEHNPFPSGGAVSMLRYRFEPD